ncbi:chaperonin 10-like protein [Suillus occidentalis]|nr:chaperonin 10-like protein [Suillus occidentalis]
MSTQQALWLPGIGQEFVVGFKGIDAPGSGELLVKIISSGLNPLDWKIQESGFIFVNSYPAVIGEEVAGIVEAVGEGVTDLKEGDRVLVNFFKRTWRANFSTFQQYCIVTAGSVAKIPDNISFDQAASVQRPEGLAHLVPWLEGGNWQVCRRPILIMGGTSTLGQYAIQLARLSGFSPIIATASSHNTELLSSLGATHVLDRKLSTTTLEDAIANITSTPIMLAFDAISLPDTQQTAHDIVATGGTIITVTAPQVESKHDDKVVQQVFGTFHLPSNHELGKRFMPVLTQWLAEGIIKPTAVEVIPGGLNDVSSGLQRLKDNLVSGKKLVVHPWVTA